MALIWHYGFLYLALIWHCKNTHDFAYPTPARPSKRPTAPAASPAPAAPLCPAYPISSRLSLRSHRLFNQLRRRSGRLGRFGRFGRPKAAAALLGATLRSKCISRANRFSSGVMRAGLDFGMGLGEASKKGWRAPCSQSLRRRARIPRCPSAWLFAHASGDEEGCVRR